MRVTVKKLRGMYRIVDEATGKLYRDEKGKPVDNGGFLHENRANYSARAYNSAFTRKANKAVKGQPKKTKRKK